MSSNKLAVLAIALWVLGAAAVGYLFVGGQTELADDGRTAIITNATEKALILAEMRAMLEAVEGVTQGIANDDPIAIAEAARAVGANAEAGVPKSLMLKLPLEFKKMGGPVHKTFDAIAAAAENGESPEMLTERLAEQLGRCTSCHASFRLK